MKHYRMRITVLSPVHIGTGEEISPFEYVIRHDAKTGYWLLHRFDLAGMLADLDEDRKKKFDEAVNHAGITFMRKFIRDHVDLPRHWFYTESVSEELASLYTEKFDDPASQLIIHACVRRPDNWSPVIPGSSIKGAIRTAIVSAEVNHLSKTEGYRPNPDNQRWEGEVLGYYGDIRQDPFRALSVEDTTLPDDSSSVAPVRIFKPDRGSASPDPAGIHQFYERIFSRLDHEEVTAEADLAINDRLGRQEYSSDREIRQAVTMPLSAEGIARTCRDFYRPKMEQDHQKFYQTSASLEQCNKPLLDETYGELEFPLRLGRFSHCECVTVDNFRQPHTRRDKNGKPLPWGTTRSLLAGDEGDLAMGWIKVSLAPAK
jgi:CRISPR-associated protein Csm5